jgi:hypothetical protein
MGCHSSGCAIYLDFIEPLFGTFLAHLSYHRAEHKWRFTLLSWARVLLNHVSQ